MKDGGVDYQIVLYGNTLHSFTNPAQNDPAHGVKYNEESDKRSWTSVRAFLKEVAGR
jgi:dienelactone hydrolase